MSQAADDTLRVSIVYTGRSLGALGVRRAQDEHELLTEQANTEHTPFKLVSHLAWRAPGVVVFMSGQEPKGDELPWILAHRAEAERLDTVRVLQSANAMLLQDPWRPSPDLIGMLERNPRRRVDFPDLVEGRASVSRIRTPDDERVYIVEQPGTVWPDDPKGWTIGEMNRVDVLESRLFELPLNLGEMGPRATLLRRLEQSARQRSTLVIAADLGHETGDLGVSDADRARLDFTALRELGYSYSVPFEFELALGNDTLRSIHKEFSQIEMLAANVRARDSTLFTRHRLITAGRVRIGVLGLVNPTIRERLPRAALRDFTFEYAVTAARREVALLRAEGADAIVVFSNMDAADNASLADEVSGVDAVVADLPVRWAPEITHERVELPARPFARPGLPSLVARSAANGVAVGRLDLEFRGRPGNDGVYLTALDHRLEPVTDRTPPDTALVREIARMASVVARPKGELMFPAFVELSDRHPELRSYDATTAQGRVSKAMWESFMARMLRVRAHAEVAVLRRLEQFPPLIGKLHENEIGAWLWTEDQIVVLDVLGSDLRNLLRNDGRGELVTSGVDLSAGTIQGHRIDDQTYYRVATVNVLYEGARSLSTGRRVRRAFAVDEKEGSGGGDLIALKGGPTLSLKEFMFSELRRIRVESHGDAYLDHIAELIGRDSSYSNLLAFTFDRPTLWVSANELRGRDGYGSVPESRVTANDSWVAGTGGHFVITQEGQNRATDFGITAAYARQGVTSGANRQASESNDDLKFDLTLRPSARANGPLVRPFIRGLFDTEFTPTVDPVTNQRNPRQLAALASTGMLLLPGQTLRRLEFAVAVENDFGRPNVQYGFQSAADFVRPIGVPGRSGSAPATYRLRNEATYLFPAAHDSPSSLSLRYNMVHELVIPLMDELSLSVAADVLMFRGKVDATRHPATSTLLRVGITYDRLWKPRFQPFL